MSKVVSDGGGGGSMLPEREVGWDMGGVSVGGGPMMVWARDGGAEGGADGGGDSNGGGSIESDLSAVCGRNAVLDLVAGCDGGPGIYEFALDVNSDGGCDGGDGMVDLGVPGADGGAGGGGSWDRSIISTSRPAGEDITKGRRKDN